MPVFAQGRQLERCQLPEVLAGISFFGVAEVRETVHETLHVQRIDQRNGAYPEEAMPAKDQAETHLHKVPSRA